MIAAETSVLGWAGLGWAGLGWAGLDGHLVIRLSAPHTSSSSGLEIILQRFSSSHSTSQCDRLLSKILIHSQSVHVLKGKSTTLKFKMWKRLSEIPNF